MKAENASHRLRVEFNPRHLGPGGVDDLLDAIHLASGSRFKIGSWLGDAHLTRIDVAVDVVGLSVPELLVSSKDEGQRAHYYGSDGALETVYLHRAPKPAKLPEVKVAWERKRGPLLVRVYDRRRWMLKIGEIPPYEPAPFTRIEVAKTKFGSTPLTVATLPSMNQPFHKIRVGQWATNAPTNFRSWIEYVNFRRAGSHEWASALLALNAADAAAFDLAFRGHPSDVLDTAAIWKWWPQGLGETGCEMLRAAARAGSAGSFMGDKLGYGPELDK